MNLRTGRTAALLLALGAVAVAAAGCVPEPATPTSSATSPSTPSASAPASPTTAPTASATPVPGIALPASCEQLYSPAMLQSLQATRSLNDPGITLYATQVAQALEILESGIPTLRCTWGTAGGPGLATQVSIVDATQSAAVRDALTGSGFSCEPLADGTICRIESRTVDMNDKVVTRGETHFLRGNGWVATSWVDDQPDGYTQDIVATLWR